jgi:hypothetical protein
MQFLKYEFRAHAGDVIEINLDHAANVLLLDSNNFSNYRSGRRYRYSGGFARRSPVRLQVPHEGHWYVVVDLGGLAGRVRANARLVC